MAKKKKAKSGATKARKAHSKQKGRKRPVGSPPSAVRAKAKKKSRPRVVAPPPREVGLLDAIGEVLAICEGLGEEMRSWADNMPESKQSSSKHDEVEQAADTLEEQAQADPVTSAPDQAFLNEIKITIQDPTPKRQARSRSTQLGDAMVILTSVMECLNSKFVEFEADDVKHAAAKEIHDALEDIESNLQGVEFPGMFG